MFWLEGYDKFFKIKSVLMFGEFLFLVKGLAWNEIWVCIFRKLIKMIND